MAVAIGIRPRKELAEQAGLLVGRGVRVNQCLQTSHPDIFAAGDVAEVLDPRSGEYVLDSLWNPAIEMGAAAGRGMAGRMTPYVKLVPFNVTRLAGLITTIIGQIASKPDALLVDHDLPGIMRGDSEIWRQHPDAVVAQRLRDGSRLRLYLSAGPHGGRDGDGRAEPLSPGAAPGAQRRRFGRPGAAAALPRRKAGRAAVGFHRVNE